MQLQNEFVTKFMWFNHEDTCFIQAYLPRAKLLSVLYFLCMI